MKAALEWQLAMGVDEAILDAPVDRTVAPEPVAATEPKVVPLRPEPVLEEASEAAPGKASDEDRITALLEPILEKHRARLQQDLLAEFAILERYEERMRRDLVAQIDKTTRRAIASALDARQHNAGKRPVSRHRTGKDFLRVAALVLALATGLTLGLAQQSKDFRGSAEAVAVSTGASEPEQLLLSDR